MKALPVGAIVLWSASIVAGLAFAVQHSRSKTLQTRESLALEATASHLASTLPRATPIDAGATSASEPLSADEKLELMRLRDRVSSLRERQRSGANVSNENTRLRSQLASFGSAAPGAIPPGYVRRVDARHVGAATPEAALESFLWAIQQRNVDAVLGLIHFTDRESENLSRRLWAEGGDQIFESVARALPGFRIAGGEELGPDWIRVDLDLGPGVTRNQQARLRRIDGAWRLESFPEDMGASIFF